MEQSQHKYGTEPAYLWNRARHIYGTELGIFKEQNQAYLLNRNSHIYETEQVYLWKRARYIYGTEPGIFMEQNQHIYGA